MAELHPHGEYTTSTVYLFFSHDFGFRNEGYSLYGMDISMSEGQVLAVEPPRLLVRLPLLTRSRMVCAKLGSKFYFLGGARLVDNRRLRLSESPSDVLVYDPTDSSLAAKDPACRVIEAEPMNYGKVDPTTFEVNGKLYVLGCCLPDVDEVSLFEEYDPVKNRWTKLEVPPVRGQKYGGCHSFVISPSRVLISSTFEDDLVIFFFNPQTYEWSSSIRSHTAFYMHTLFAEDSFYGVKGRFKPHKLCPHTLAEDDQLFHVPIAPDPYIDWGDTSPISRQNTPPLTRFSSVPLICHLSDRRFGIIESASCVKPGLKANLPDPYHRLLKIIIYKELQGDETCFKLRCLHQSVIPIKTDFDSLGILSSCHVMSTEEKNKGIQVDDQKIGTDRKRKREEDAVE